MDYTNLKGFTSARPCFVIGQEIKRGKTLLTVRMVDNHSTRKIIASAFELPPEFAPADWSGGFKTLEQLHRARRNGR